jgi:hypothetical protein
MTHTVVKTYYTIKIDATTRVVIIPHIPLLITIKWDVCRQIKFMTSVSTYWKLYLSQNFLNVFFFSKLTLSWYALWRSRMDLLFKCAGLLFTRLKQINGEASIVYFLYPWPSWIITLTHDPRRKKKYDLAKIVLCTTGIFLDFSFYKKYFQLQ